MTTPFLSIVTISFNQAQHLRQCVDSVLSQKGANAEYIVVDPGSTDGSREILASYGSAIDHLILRSDQGPADGLNRGFSRATGEIGYFINSDDFLLPGAIRCMFRRWEEHQAFDFLLGGGWMVDGRGRPIRELFADSGDLDALLDGNAAVVQQGFSFRMDKFRQIGGFNASNRSCWDFELLCSALRNGARTKIIHDRIGAFRIYGESLSGGVRGSAHVFRYRDDFCRLYYDTTGRAFQQKGPMMRTLARAQSRIKQPANTLRQMLDRLFPSRLRRRFELDMQKAEARFS